MEPDFDDLYSSWIESLPDKAKESLSDEATTTATLNTEWHGLIARAQRQIQERQIQERQIQERQIEEQEIQEHQN